MLKQYVIGSAVALAALIAAAPAHAEEAFTANKFQIGGGLDYGVYMGDDEGDPPNPYGPGLGIDLGYTLGPGVYLGGEFNYFFGGSEEAAGIEASWNIMQYGVEVGYDIGISPELVIRPKIGVGMASTTMDVSGEVLGVSFDDSETESGLFIPIGAGVMYSMGSWFLGGDLRYAIYGVTTESDDGMGGTVETDTNLAGLLIGINAGGAF